jgi:uncharacterized membrane protein
MHIDVFIHTEFEGDFFLLITFIVASNYAQIFHVVVEPETFFALAVFFAISIWSEIINIHVHYEFTNHCLIRLIIIMIVMYGVMYFMKYKTISMNPRELNL